MRFEYVRTITGTVNPTKLIVVFPEEWQDYVSRTGGDEEGFARESAEVMGLDFADDAWIDGMDDDEEVSVA